MKLLNLLTISVLITLSGTSYAQGAGIDVKVKKTSVPALKSFKVKGAIPSALRGGTSGVGGGGDDIALEFQQYAAQALKDIQAQPETFGKYSLKEILATLSDIQVVIVDESLDIETKELIQNSVAVNIPEKNLIFVNRVRWGAVEDVRMRKAISLHEVLSLKKVEQTGYYPVSSKYLNSLGVNSKALASNLQVNRLRQIQVQNPAKKAGDVLKQFYDEAREDISLADIPSLESLLTGEIACRSAEVSKDLSEDLNEQSFGYFIADVMTRESKESNGPLFPGHAEIREKRIGYINFLSYKQTDYKKNPKRTLADILNDFKKSANFVGSTLIVKKDELLQRNPALPSDVVRRYPPTTQSIKKNNGLLVFKVGLTEYWGQESDSDLIYGYCYNVNN